MPCYSAEEQQEIIRLYDSAYRHARKQVKEYLKADQSFTNVIGRAKSMWGAAAVGLMFQFPGQPAPVGEQIEEGE